jgi:hypothetical protein
MVLLRAVRRVYVIRIVAFVCALRVACCHRRAQRAFARDRHQAEEIRASGEEVTRRLRRADGMVLAVAVFVVTTGVVRVTGVRSRGHVNGRRNRRA